MKLLSWFVLVAVGAFKGLQDNGEQDDKLIRKGVLFQGFSAAALLVAVPNVDGAVAHSTGNETHGEGAVLLPDALVAPRYAVEAILDQKKCVCACGKRDGDGVDWFSRRATYFNLQATELAHVW